jgi:hypothetical protein
VDCRDDPDCLELVQSARRLSGANQLNAALTSYQTAYALHGSPWLLINIGRVQQKLGRPAEAILSYRGYLDAQPLAGDSVDLARRYLRQAEQDLDSQRETLRQAALRPREKPIYKKGWLWLVIGSSVAAASAITAGVVLGISAGSTSDRSLPAHSVSFMF